MGKASHGLVSILMPAYNGAGYIQQAIESVISQTYSAWELIIIDDGSRDNTADIVSQYDDFRIHYIYQENKGQASALNRGLELAAGEYITTLDVDDWFTPNSLQGRVEFLDRNRKYDVVYGDGIFCDKDGNQLKRFSELRTGEVVGDVFDIMLSNSFFGTGANVMIRKSTIDENQIRYDESIVWCQDYDFYLRLAEICQFGYVDITTIWYRLHTANMTMSMPSGRKKESLIRVKQKALATSRFASTSLVHKLNFFYHLLLVDLESLPEQLEILNHPHFKDLPKNQQARMIRLLASKYLAERKHPDQVKTLLGKSFNLNPFDTRVYLLLVFSYFNGWPAEWAFNYWRRNRLHTGTVSSPFDQIKE